MRDVPQAFIMIKDKAAMKHRFFWALNRFVLMRKFQFLALLMTFSGIFLWYCISIDDKNEVAATSYSLADKARQNRDDISMENSTPSITLFVRMAGKLKTHRTRFYCDFFRTAVLFWPASFGKTVVVLDEESEQDHIFANNLTNQVKQHFPGRKLEVAFESLPKDASILNVTASKKSPGYNRQLWSSFFIDLYTDDPIVAWMDSDVSFLTPVTKATIFNGSKIRILGSQCSMKLHRVRTWAHTTEIALGFPMVADFMTYFPVYLFRDTFTHCREYILKRFNTSNFEEAFQKIYHGHNLISPVSVVISYAWFFERDRYDWNLKICGDLQSYNKRLPAGHRITPQDTEDILSQLQTAFHVPYAKEPLFPNILISYCLSHKAAGNPQAMCSNHSVSLADNFVLFYHDLQRITPGETPCTGNKKNHCLKVLDQHYKQVGLDIRKGRKIEWKDFETVETSANEIGIMCSKLVMNGGKIERH